MAATGAVGREPVSPVRTLEKRLAGIEAPLSPKIHIIAVSDAAEADRVRAATTGGLLIVITGVPRAAERATHEAEI
jgi:hypothetical protein